ncbi:MAG: sulfurtransferase-like selenium metabolism protein YedF [Armatimonadetes bacterium]|nr:sulfurtransferase-like selenium metabolism protein YedF [Armatimonadota bacterium]
MSPDAPVLDCRGMLCPKPLLEARQAIEALPEGSLIVLVDNLAAKENVTQAMVELGHDVFSELGDGVWSVTVTKAAGARHEAEMSPSPAGTTVLFVADRGLGRSDPDLGALLMRAFMATIADRPQAPDVIALMQGGVRLACEGSAVLQQLTALQERGAEILVCGTCLDYFGLMGKLQAGRVSNMAEIAGALMTAIRVIPL